MTTPQTPPMPTPVQLVSDNVYDRLRQAAAIGLPALQALWIAMVAIWGLPMGEQVSGTLAAVNIAVGSFCALAKMVHTRTGAGVDGVLSFINTEQGTLLQFQGIQPGALDKSMVTFRVDQPQDDDPEAGHVDS